MSSDNSFTVELAGLPGYTQADFDRFVEAFSRSSTRWILDEEGNPEKTFSELVWVDWKIKADQDGSRRVAITELTDGSKVSTVFLGIDYAIDGPPLLYETMLFSTNGDILGLCDECLRASTKEEAQANHDDIVGQVTRLMQSRSKFVSLLRARAASLQKTLARALVEGEEALFW